MKKIIYLFIFIIFFQPTYSSSSSYLMLKNSEVNVRYGPGFSYPIKFKYKKRFLPLKVIDKKENFRKIIDHKKNSGWIHWTQLKKSKSFILLENQILFSKPTKYSKPVAKIFTGSSYHLHDTFCMYAALRERNKSNKNEKRVMNKILNFEK